MQKCISLLFLLNPILLKPHPKQKRTPQHKRHKIQHHRNRILPLPQPRTEEAPCAHLHPRRVYVSCIAQQQREYNGSPDPYIICGAEHEGFDDGEEEVAGCELVVYDLRFGRVARVMGHVFEVGLRLPVEMVHAAEGGPGLEPEVP